ncbi:MAG TPA: glycosyltransferase [Nocardioides sp.]|nr:glycosyltransferase [Nocardioides sp.]
MRILFASWPGHGHLLPMLPLARAAERAGHQVMVTSGPDLADLTRGLGLDFRASGMTAAEIYAQVPDTGGSIDALPDEEKVRFAARHVFGPGAMSRALDLLAMVPAWQPDVVVHDTLELGAPVAAEAFGVPHVTHGFGPMLPENAALVAAVGSYIEEADVPDPALDAFAAPYLDVCPPGLAGVSPGPWKDVVPLRPSAGEPGPASDVLGLLDALPHHDTVYVTLGTVLNRAPRVFRAVLDGCAALPVNVVATTGPGSDRSAIDGGPAVLARPWIPQTEVLPHCRVVVSHAGAGTMLGALCHGLPQLCLPQGTDQPLNAASLAPTGAALVLNPDQLTAEAVEHAVCQLLEDPSYAAAATTLRERIDEMPTADQVLAELMG